MSRFPTIFKLDDGLPDLLDPRRVLVIQLIQLGQRMLDFAIAGNTLLAAAERDCSLQLHLRHCRAALVIHRGEPVQFFQTDDLVRAREIGKFVLELLGAHPRVRRIDLDLLDRRSVLLQFR
ncbi:hypothetical protein DF121_08070 [Burkholderia stagnalis]|nr:hypothetical protein DF121_08070 [Burkholderia stagnalis]